MINLLNIIISWAIVSFGQPAWAAWLSPCAGAFGYALFWIGCRAYSARTKAVISGVWFASVHLIQLSWMTSIEFQGIYILFVYVGLCLWQGLQFALLTLFVFTKQNQASLPPSLSLMRILAGASVWTLLEWSRLSFLCGFTWNPMGLCLAAYLPSLQFSAIWGVYGLSFWVIATNLTAAKAWFSRGKVRVRALLSWMILAGFPTCFGLMSLKASKDNQGEIISAALVQTGLLPSQKVPLPGRYEEFISPFEQWSEVVDLLAQPGQVQWDFIVLPEAVVPFSMAEGIYPYPMVVASLTKKFGEGVQRIFPPLEAPFAQQRVVDGSRIWCVSNAFWGQWIANFFNAEVVAGLDCRDLKEGKNYNSAFYFHPKRNQAVRYDKQVLLPLAEYLPWSWLKRLTQNYGISEFFTPGTGAKIISGKVPLSISICYEETFAELIREGRKLGAEMLINVTNDNYYPNSRLPRQHFDHGKLRAVENGVPLLRACNTGVTGAVDSCGRIISMLGDGTKESELMRGVLHVAIPRESHFTLYRFWGDAGIIALSMALLMIFLRRRLYFKSSRESSG